MVWDFLFGEKKTHTGDISLDVADPRTQESHCLISGNLHIRGDVFFSGILRIDGRVDGKIAVYEGGRGQLVVGKGALINGPVAVTSAIIDGTVAGQMTVENRLECRTHAVLRGDVAYGAIHIADGAQIEAKCRQRQTGSSGDQSLTNFLAKKR